MTTTPVVFGTFPEETQTDIYERSPQNWPTRRYSNTEAYCCHRFPVLTINVIFEVLCFTFKRDEFYYLLYLACDFDSMPVAKGRGSLTRRHDSLWLKRDTPTTEKTL